jgi:hypothetical protein
VKTRPLTALCTCLAAAGCGGILDAGKNAPHGPLPVDERNPVIIHNDSASDDWMGEYALLLARNGGPSIASIIVCSSKYWPDLDTNVMGWTNFVNALTPIGRFGSGCSSSECSDLPERRPCAERGSWLNLSPRSGLSQRPRSCHAIGGVSVPHRVFFGAGFERSGLFAVMAARAFTAGRCRSRRRTS